MKYTRSHGSGLLGTGQAALSLALLLAASSCSSKPTDGAASAEPIALPSASPLAPPSAAHAELAQPASPPTLHAVPVHEEDKALVGVSLFTLPGAVLVATSDRIGRLTAAGIEWKGKLDEARTAHDGVQISWVGGLYPDAIDLTWTSSNGRAPTPSYRALTGKGASLTFSPGAGFGWIDGVARIGESVLVSGYDLYKGHLIAGVRGPAITRLRVAWPLKCKKEAPRDGFVPGSVAPAVQPERFVATRAGTLFSYGKLCEEEAAVEVWAKEGGQPRIFELAALTRHPGKLVVGKDDEAWIMGEPILAWKGDHFEPLPAQPSRPIKNAFVSTAGDLYLLDGVGILKLESGKLVEVARLGWPADFGSIASEDSTFWVTQGGRLQRLEKTEPVTTGEACKTPFVFLYDVSWKSELGYTFPTTRKALASFAPLEGVELVDFVAGSRRLGAVVPSWEVGVALAAHVAKSMKDEHPQVVCFAPTSPRAIPIAGGK